MDIFSNSNSLFKIALWLGFGIAILVPYAVFYWLWKRNLGSYRRLEQRFYADQANSKRLWDERAGLMSETQEVRALLASEQSRVEDFKSQWVGLNAELQMDQAALFDERRRVSLLVDRCAEVSATLEVERAQFQTLSLQTEALKTELDRAQSQLRAAENLLRALGAVQEAGIESPTPNQGALTKR